MVMASSLPGFTLSFVTPHTLDPLFHLREPVRLSLAPARTRTLGNIMAIKVGTSCTERHVHSSGWDGNHSYVVTWFVAQRTTTIFSGKSSSSNSLIDRRVSDTGSFQECPKQQDRKSTRLNSSHSGESRMPSSA